jgi:hypothetical protein
MDNKEFAKDLENRTKLFAIAILRLSSKLPNSQEARVIRNQISKSGTSVGANYREANRARSKADFANKLKMSVIVFKRNEVMGFFFNFSSLKTLGTLNLKKI